jgi:hypothetical protein
MKRGPSKGYLDISIIDNLVVIDSVLVTSKNLLIG